MTIYIDADYKAYTEPEDGRSAVETSVFDSMPAPVIGCHRYIPEGKTWISQEGLEIHGEFIQMCVTEKELDDAQREYERQQLMDANAQNAELLGTMAAMVEEVYESDLAVFEEG